MIEEQFKVLKTLSEATGHMDLKSFAEKANLSTAQALQDMQDLAKEGYLQRVGGGYGITLKGKNALKAFTPVPEGQSFHFYFDIGQPSDFEAQSLATFYGVIKEISVESIEFHLYREDFQNWLRQACREPELEKEFDGIRSRGLKGEELRSELVRALDAKYGVEKLI